MAGMNSILLLAGVGIGALLGAVIGFLYARARLASASADLAAQARAADERAHAAQERAQLASQAAQERAELVDSYLAERFQALSSQALDASQQRLLELSEIRLRAAQLSAASELDSRRSAVEQLVDPLRQTLARVEAQLRETESARQSSHAALAEQVKSARETSE
jgi:DNA recombination protein RmuC